MIPITERPFEHEIEFRTSRSGGPGGQHVNKTESKVELFFDIASSDLLSPWEKETLFSKLSNKINRSGQLYFSVEEHRSQHKNKDLALQRFYSLIGEALRKRKKRIPTKPSKAAKKQRLEEKKQHAEKKARRKGNDFF
ncbi:MAG: alternative ribosome rescue aminoacyl-tRNA hydrolase ArfB [Bacteroidota bacterium]